MESFSCQILHYGVLKSYKKYQVIYNFILAFEFRSSENKHWVQKQFFLNNKCRDNIFTKRIQSQLNEIILKCQILQILRKTISNIV